MVGLVLASGCGRKEEPAPATSGAAPSSAAAVVVTNEPGRSDVAATASAVPAAPWLSEVEVKAALDAWLAAQNAVRFEDYAKLYADRFTGTKRVGQRTSRFNRQSWLADRESMFKPGLQVEASDVEVVVSGPSVAQATFVQRFRTARFSDQGKKRLLFTRDPSGLRIATEEMLDSAVEFAAAANEEAVWWLREGVLHTRKTVPKAALASAAPTNYVERDGVYTLEATLDQASLPASAKGWSEGRFELVTAAGKTCDVVVKGARARVELVPHFGMVAGWKGENGEVPASRAEIAKQVWELAGDEVPLTLVADASCGKSGVVVPASSVAARWLPVEKPSAEVERWVRLRFLESRELDALRKEAPAGWPKAEDVRVSVFETPGGERWALASAAFERECAEKPGLTVAFELAKGKDPAVLQRFVTIGEPVSPLGLLWTKSGSGPAVVGAPRDVARKQELWRLDAKGALSPLHSVQYFDCPC